MKYMGDIAEDATIRGSFNTRDTDGAPITLAGTPSVAVYKDGGTTEITAGVSLSVDFDSRTGHHVWTIDTSADAAYATGSDYRVVLTAGTVDSISVVGVEVGCFSIQNRYMRGTNSANTTTPPTVGDIADAVWDEATSGHSTSGTTGAAIIAAGSAGDPWSASLPGAYGSGTAGKILGDNLNATISSRSSHAAADIWSVGTRTITGGSLTTSPPTAAAIADAVWDESRLGHTTDGTFGFYLDAAISGVSGGGGLDAAGVRTAIGLANANLDTQLGSIKTDTGTTLPAAITAALATQTYVSDAY